MKRYVQNDGKNTIFVSGTMIAPGEGREVDADFMDDPLDGAATALPADQEPDLDANLRDMLDQPVKTLLPLLADASDDTLAGLARLEGEKPDPRKTLLAAIAELQLGRAQAKTGVPQ